LPRGEQIVSTTQLDKAVEKFSSILIESAKAVTTYREFIPKAHFYTREIKQLVRERRRLRHKWMRTRNPTDKTAFNRLNKAVKLKLANHNEESFQNYLKSLSPTSDTDYSLWQASKRLGRPAKCNLPLKNDRER
jgi:hypothetical protein